MKRIGTLVLGALVVLFVYIGYRYVSYRTHNAVSDAAFVRTDSLLTLGFKVDGKVIKMRKKEGDPVRKGELLALIDPKDFQRALAAVEKERSALAQKREALVVQRTSAAQELDVQERITRNDRRKMVEDIKSFGYQIAANEVKLAQAKRDLHRYEALYKKRLVQREVYEKSKSAYESLRNLVLAQKSKLAALEIALENLDEKLKLIAIKRKGLARLDHQIEALGAQEEALGQKAKELEDKIAYCRLYAPMDAQVAKRFVNVDRVVEAGNPIYAIVNPKDIHIEVLLSEKKLKGVKPGNEVAITIDAYPKRHYHGKVQKILPASAATFALVPRDIASGEFTKLDQRFVVRISIDDPTPDLRVGMGASVAIERD